VPEVSLRLVHPVTAAFHRSFNATTDHARRLGPDGLHRTEKLGYPIKEALAPVGAA
jgi:hypothetical protein